MNTRQKKALYESIMKSVAKTVKNNLNEMAKHTDKNLNNSIIKELSIIMSLSSVGNVILLVSPFFNVLQTLSNIFINIGS